MSVLQFALHSREYLWFSNENGWLKNCFRFRRLCPRPGCLGYPREIWRTAFRKGRHGIRIMGFLRKETNYGKSLMERNPQTHTVIRDTWFFLLHFLSYNLWSYHLYLLLICHDLCFEQKKQCSFAVAHATIMYAGPSSPEIQKQLCSDIGGVPKMVGFPNKPTGFPTRIDHFGVEIELGVPPFKETPIYTTLWQKLVHHHVSITCWLSWGLLPSLKLTAKAPENGWLEYFLVSF